MATELRLALTVEDFEGAIAFYRDALGLREQAAWESRGGRVVVLDAGRATLELLDRGHAAAVDAIEVGSSAKAPFRVALEVEDSAALADELESAGAERLGHGPVVTPWRHRNIRLRAPDGTQLTLFTPLD